MNKRKVLIIVENLPVPFDTRVWQEATTLVDNGYTVSVICPKGKNLTKAYEMKDGVHIFRHDLNVEGNGFIGYVREYFSALYHELRLARKIYKTIGFDVIHGCNPPDNIFLIALFFRRKGVRYIFDHHDICPELYYAKFKKYGLLYRSQLLLERLNYRRASMAFVTNESYKKIAIARGKKEEKDIFILRSGPNLKRLKIRPKKEALKQGKTYMVGYVGVIGQQEGIDYLLEAISYIKHIKKREDIFFGICGGGPYLEEVRERIHKMKIADMVEFTGRISDDLLLDYLNTADICVNPDEYNEMNDKSTMNKVLEYMALGKPIVQFDLTEGRNSAKEASLYAEKNDAIDFAEKMLTLLGDEALRAKMGAYGRRRIEEKLSWEHTSQALIKGYNYYYTVISGQLKSEGAFQ
jgi:glycosyltransferase involved in cell wall biosynthesis